MAAAPDDLHRLAAAHRRAADRLTLLRLRLARGMSALEGGVVHETWVEEVYPGIGALVRALRADHDRLEAEAAAAERASGRRMGGYAGAGFLGRGDRAREQVEQVRQVIAFRGHDLGASIGGYPLSPRGRAVPPHPSETLGAATPGYEDED
ncbi:hypothetical protein [Brachybacterium phenoliresistens]|uniref:hypothetical protein n=1 Tax=Brachybacterium phenoliresistens TaxID=396014 RepID=UPI0031DC0F42